MARKTRRRSTSTAVRCAAVLVATAAMLSPAAPAAADDPPPDPGDPFVAAMTDTLTTTATTSAYLGPALSGIVVDADDGTVLWRHGDSRARVPASAEKLLTAHTVLESVPPATTLDTVTCRTTRQPAAVYVRGGGDPSLSGARVQALAAQTAAGVKRAGRTTVSLHLDGSVFPAPTSAPGWPASYLRSEVQQVRGLTLAGYRGPDGRTAVGKAMVAALKKQGIVATVAGPAVTPKSCARLGTTRSAPVSALVGAMLARSDNDYAEFLLRRAAIDRGYPPSWRGALANQRELLVRAGVPTSGLAMFDGSGLSRANRMPVATLAAVLRVLRDDPDHAAIVFARTGLPLAGQTGTLVKRFSAPDQVCARGRVQAKTGSLSDAVALAGVAQGVDGRERVFVFLENGLKKNTSVRAAVDTLATAVVGCNQL